MTGYGRGQAEDDGKRAIIEIRAVNHRFLDLKLRGASLDAAGPGLDSTGSSTPGPAPGPTVEDRLIAAIRGACERGALTVTVRVEDRAAPSGVRIDREAARRAHAELTALAQDLGISEPVTLGMVCAQPGVMLARDTNHEAEALARCVDAAGAQALAGLIAMREAEGQTLMHDIEARVSRLDELAGEIAGHAASTPEQAQRRLQERLSRLLDKSRVEIDPVRLAQEVAILADRLDVTEELVRLRSHLGQIRQVMAMSGGVGRRLDFLVQELGRELNTIASKSQSADIARAVVEARAELEKIREQVQNIE